MKVNIPVIILIICGFIWPGFRAAAQDEDKATRYIQLADSADNLMKRERWADAEPVIIRALRLQPGNFGNALLLSNLGVVRTHLGKYDEALQAFDTGLAISPNSSVIYANRARTLLHLGEYSSALNDLNKTLSIDSIQEWPLQMRGLLLLACDSIEAARTDFTRLGRLYPKNPRSMSGLARIAEMEGKTDEALSLYDRAISLEDDPYTRFSRILLKLNTGKLPEAGEDIRESLSRYPEVPDFYLARGILHRLNYRYEEAEIDKKIALDKGADPQFVEQFLPKIKK